MRRTLSIAVLLLALACSVSEARRLKIYSYPNTIAPGQYSYIIFENPNATQVFARTKCDAEKLPSMMKQDVPILRIDQNGKQVFTSLGSYRTLGDSCVAAWIIPMTVSPGEATLYIINDRDVSTPYKITIAPKMDCKLIAVSTGPLKPSERFSLVAEGYVPTDTTDRKIAIEKLRQNFSYDALSKADQFRELNKKLTVSWPTVSTGEYVTIEQGGQHWNIFVEGCGIDRQGTTLDFTCPPDLKSGAASIVLNLRYNGNDIAKSQPLQVTVQ